MDILYNLCCENIIKEADIGLSFVLTDDQINLCQQINNVSMVRELIEYCKT